MGNTLSDTGSLRTDTILGQYVNQWALNDYNPNPTAEAQNLFKQSLKKRACCTGQKEIQISLPDVNEDDVIISSLGVKVFNKDEDINIENCNLISKNSGEKEQYKFTEKKGGLVLADNNSCKTFYGQLCQNAINDRVDPELTKSQKYYSVYGDQIDGENYTKQNPYIDCNCENSFFVKDRDLFQQNQYDVQTLAQSNDIRCSGPSHKTFKQVDKKVGNICINMARVGAVSQSDASSLNIGQNCSINTGGSNQQQGSGSNSGSGSGSNNQGSNSGSGSGSQQQGSGSGSQQQGSGNGSNNQGSGSGSNNQGSGSGSQQQGSGSGSNNQGSGSGSQQQGSGSSNQGSNSNKNNQETKTDKKNEKKDESIIDTINKFSETKLGHKYTFWIIIGVLLVLLLILLLRFGGNNRPGQMGPMGMPQPNMYMQQPIQQPMYQPPMGYYEE